MTALSTRRRSLPLVALTQALSLLASPAAAVEISRVVDSEARETLTTLRQISSAPVEVNLSRETAHYNFLWDSHRLQSPGKVTSPNYRSSSDDGGGVHTNSGVPNHAYEMHRWKTSLRGLARSSRGLASSGEN